MQLSYHARFRAQQRGIPEYVVDLICAYGRPSHTRGALSLSLDEESLDRAAEDLTHDRVARLAQFRDVYAIEDGATVITVARAKRRHREN